MAGTFGRRQMQMAAAAPRASVAAAPRAEASVSAPVAQALTPARTPPFVTLGLLVLLTLVFMWEVQASPVLHRGYTPPVSALIGFGAIDGALMRDGGWWRILTAPLLHASFSHLISNGVVLGVIGFMLEPLVGPRWFAALYAAGAVGGFCVRSCSIRPTFRRSVRRAPSWVCWRARSSAAPAPRRDLRDGGCRPGRCA